MSHPPVFSQKMLLSSLYFYGRNPDFFNDRLLKMQGYHDSIHTALSSLSQDIHVLPKGVPPFALTDVSDFAHQYDTNASGIRDYLLESNPSFGVAAATGFGPNPNYLRFSVSAFSSETEVQDFQDRMNSLISDREGLKAFFHPKSK
jgi:hypothetical protein